MTPFRLQSPLALQLKVRGLAPMEDAKVLRAPAHPPGSGQLQLALLHVKLLDAAGKLQSLREHWSGLLGDPTTSTCSWHQLVCGGRPSAEDHPSTPLTHPGGAAPVMLHIPVIPDTNKAKPPAMLQLYALYWVLGVKSMVVLHVLLGSPVTPGHTWGRSPVQVMQPWPVQPGAHVQLLVLVFHVPALQRLLREAASTAPSRAFTRGLGVAAAAAAGGGSGAASRHSCIADASGDAVEGRLVAVRHLPHERNGMQKGTLVPTAVCG
jgi:hypothetical protein